MGDLGHIRYEQKLGTHTWQVARVVKVKLGDDQVVRTIMVNFRPRHVSDLCKKYVSKHPEEMEIGVQRFAVLLPIKEHGEDLVSTEDTDSVPQSSEMTLN